MTPPSPSPSPSLPPATLIGSDISVPLAHICAARGFQVFAADALNLPVLPARFDAAISIAVLHHISSPERRQLAVREILRILRPGGRALITVWAREQEDQLLIAKWTPLMGRFTERWAGEGDGEQRQGEGCNETREEGLETSSGARGRGKGKGNGREGLPPLAESVGDGGEEGDEGEDCEVRRGERGSAVEDCSGGGMVNVTISEEKQQQEQQQQQQQQQQEQEEGDGKEGRQQEHEYSGSEAHESEHGDYLVPWHLPLHRVEVGSARAADDVASGLAKRDDKKGSVVYHRFYHVFTKGELER